MVYPSPRCCEKFGQTIGDYAMRMGLKHFPLLISPLRNLVPGSSEDSYGGSLA